ncbi:hypothetical protein BD626DRAFT_130465 [Schizophyllum amplum]|uniref:Uncharacterized protein n=1 Tax=Schizophyllum amplum TaxID=97359 RepID=A0A550C682_9AGAR|nr:hypothetical protein BD626DRAFT_130465 [Auriculariopsis ampla]
MVSIELVSRWRLRTGDVLCTCRRVSAWRVGRCRERLAGALARWEGERGGSGSCWWRLCRALGSLCRSFRAQPLHLHYFSGISPCSFPSRFRLTYSFSVSPYSFSVSLRSFSVFSLLLLGFLLVLLRTYLLHLLFSDFFLCVTLIPFTIFPQPFPLIPPELRRKVQLRPPPRR